MQPRVQIGWILAVSGLLKILVLLSLTSPWRLAGGDTKTYLPAAEALLEHGAFAPSAAEPSVPETLRTPGYPLFMAACLGVASRDLRAVALAQVVLSLLTLALAAHLAAERWTIGTGRWAALLLSLDAASFAASLLLLSETLFTFLLVAALWSFVRFQKEVALRWPLLAGLLLGSAVLVRPIAYYLPIALAAWLVVAGWRGERRRAFAAALAFLLPVAVLTGGWQLRNKARTGTALLSRISGVNLIFYRAAAVVALRDGVDLPEARRRLTGFETYGREVLDAHPDETPEELAQRWTSEGLAILVAHPGLVLQTQAAALPHLAFGLGHHALFEILGRAVPREGPLGDLLRLDAGAYVERWVIGRKGAWLAFVAEEVYLLALYLLAGFGLVRAWRRRELGWQDGALWMTLLYLALISLGPEVNARFRVPLMPFLAVCAAAGLATPSGRL